MKNENAKVYLAGKVRHGNENWREKLLADRQQGTRHAANLTWRALATHTAQEVLRTMAPKPLKTAGFELSGPYIVSREPAGYANAAAYGAEVFSAANSSGTINPETRAAARRVLLDLNTLLLDAADVMFVWLDATDGFGTIAEIGQAYLSKPIFLSFSTGIAPEQLDDLWYSTNMADKVVFANSPDEAFAEFSSWYQAEGRRVRAMG